MLKYHEQEAKICRARASAARFNDRHEHGWLLGTYIKLGPGVTKVGGVCMCSAPNATNAHSPPVARAAPRNCRSMRRDSWRSVPSICKTAEFRDAGAQLDVRARPAMFVEIVTAPRWPARETISASCSWYFALRTE